MAQLRTYRSTGTIPQASGAAAAALKARAAAWEVDLIESPGQIGMVLWGCEFWLIHDGASIRVELSGPEARLVGNLRDTASEIMAEVGLTVQWDRLDVGALAPGLSLFTLTSVRPRSPNFLRVRVTGDDAARFGQGSLHFRLLIAPEGRDPVWPRIGETGRTIWPDGADALHRPVYTVAAQGADWLDFDIFLHDGSPTCAWAAHALPGTPVGLLGPGGGWCPTAANLRLFGDQTALPAIVRMLDLCLGDATAVLRCMPADLGPFAADPRVTIVDDLLAALSECDIPDDSHVWFAASGSEARKARAHLAARGLHKRDFTAATYWD